MRDNLHSQQRRDIGPVLDLCWPTVFDAGPTLIQHWANILCLVGYRQVIFYKQVHSRTTEQILIQAPHGILK